jgi:hypothetical protein
MKRGKSFKYFYKNKQRIYFSNFFIESLNLIIEIKNKYLFKRDKYILEKKAVIKNGYNYIIIINKNYKKFIKNYLKHYDSRKLYKI